MPNLLNTVTPVSYFIFFKFILLLPFFFKVLRLIELTLSVYVFDCMYTVHVSTGVYDKQSGGLNSLDLEF